MPSYPPGAEAAARREEHDALAAQLVAAQAADVRDQLMTLTQLFCERTGCSREDCNRLIAERRRQERTPT